MSEYEHQERETGPSDALLTTTSPRESTRPQQPQQQPRQHTISPDNETLRGQQPSTGSTLGPTSDTRPHQARANEGVQATGEGNSDGAPPSSRDSTALRSQFVCRTQNLRGFHREGKNRQRWMTAWKKQHDGNAHDFTFVQESHVNSADEVLQLQNQWLRVHGISQASSDEFSFWSVGGARAKGVGILVNPHRHRGFHPLWPEEWSDRFLAITNESISLICVYGPNDSSAKSAFYSNLRREPLPHEGMVIVAGDFNAVSTPALDRHKTTGSVAHKTECAAMDDWLRELGVLDTLTDWGSRVETARQVEKFQRTRHTYLHGGGSSRLDRVYISTSHRSWIAHHEATAPPNHSDHREVTVFLRAPSQAAPKRKTQPLYRVPQEQREEF